MSRRQRRRRPGPGLHLSRRDLLKLGLAGGAYALLPGSKLLALSPSSGDDRPSPPTRPFVDPLPIPPTAMTTAAGDFSPAIVDCPDSVVDPNVQLFKFFEEEALVQLHSDLPPTPIWRYRDVNDAAGLAAAGPTFKIYMNEEPLRSTVGAGPVVVRFVNNLPFDHRGFGCPCSTVHFHGGHAEAVSDGFPENVDFFARPIVFAPMGLVGCEPPEGIDEMVAGCDEFAPYFRDYCYAMKDVGFLTGPKKPEERAATNWYHDHLFDFTGPNVYRGLAGLFTVFDEFDANDETGALFPWTNLRLPSGDYDVPLILQDKRFVVENGVAALVYTLEHDGFLGDKFLVNGKIQPYFVVERRKYRFRILDASNARFYQLFLTKNGRQETFTEIGGHGSLFNYPLHDRRSLLVTPAERHDIVIDFSRYRTGDVLYLEDRLGQDDGRGPDGTFDRPRQRATVKLVKFIVGNPPAVPDPSRSNFDLRGTRREIVAISEAEKRAARRRTFIFDRRQGAWSINNMLADLEHPIASPQLDRGEIWTLKNGGGGWWHPIHVHLEFMRVLKRNGKRPPQDERDGFAKEDTIIMGPGDELEVFLKFRDYPGPFVFHCHNVEHEDMRMMARFDVVT